jgi:hypothetical protein
MTGCCCIAWGPACTACTGRQPLAPAAGAATPPPPPPPLRLVGPHLGQGLSRVRHRLLVLAAPAAAAPRSEWSSCGMPSVGVTAAAARAAHLQRSSTEAGRGAMGLRWSIRPLTAIRLWRRRFVSACSTWRVGWMRRATLPKCPGLCQNMSSWARYPVRRRPPTRAAPTVIAAGPRRRPRGCRAGCGARCGAARRSAAQRRGPAGAARLAAGLPNGGL